MIALETMLHDEEVDADETWLTRSSRLAFFIELVDLAFAHLVSVLHFLDEGSVRVVTVALFEDDRAHLSQGLLDALRLDFQLR